MARQMNKLTARQVEAATFHGRAFKLFDGGGLFLHVQERGKYWRLKYRWEGKEKLLALGVYPEVKLAGARQGRDKAREQIAQGIDPSTARQAAKAARMEAAENTLEVVAREWWDTVHCHEVQADHAHKNLRRLENHVFPHLGHRPIAEITPAELLEVLRRLEARGQVENAHRVKTLCGQVWRYGIPTGRVERDITADLKDALRPTRTKHQPAITDPKELGNLLRAIDDYSGQPATVAALRLLPILFVRPGELRKAEWEAFDLEEGTWEYRPSKDGNPLYTPLPHQALEVLHWMRPISGGGHYVFPASRGRGRPLSENTINAALKNLGYGDQVVGHGFRATARTLLVERLGYPQEIVEMQLGHAVRDPNGRAYNRTTFPDQRRHMLQEWADYLDHLKAEG